MSGIVEVSSGERSFVGGVLLVDDMQEDADLLAVLLEPLGTSVFVAGSAGEALEVLDRQAVDKQVVDLVVTDLNMPGASGLELARDIRRRLVAPAVIFMTGSQSAGDEVAAFALGAIAYLKKPIDVDHLIRLARKVLRSRCAERRSDAFLEGANTKSRAH